MINNIQREKVNPAITNPKVVFLCRGSVHDGIGHITRSRSVAQQASGQASIQFFVIGDRSLENLLKSSNFAYLFFEFESEILSPLHSFNPDIVFFDMTHLERTLFCKIKKSRLSVSISPIFNQNPFVDVIFHRTKYFAYEKEEHGLTPTIRNGIEYTVIGKHLERISEEQYEKNLNKNPFSIAISMGGTDAANKTLKILKTLRKMDKKITIWVLLGEGYSHSYQTLVDCMEGGFHEIILAKTNDSMCRVLHMCSLIVLAGGVTTYESTFLGIPSLNLLENKEHFFLIRELVEKDICISADKEFPQSLDTLLNEIIALEQNRDRLLQMHKNAINVIDGQGAERIISETFEIWRSGNIFT